MLMNHLEGLESPRSFALTPDELTPILANVSLSPQSVSDEALVLNFRFEERSGLQALDSAPNGRHIGSLRKGARFGNLNDRHQGIIRLDGIDDHLRVNSTSDLNLSPQAQRTVSLWLRADDLNPSGKKQVLYEEGGQGKGLNIYLDQGKLYVGIWVADQWMTFLSSEAIEANRWHNVVLVLDAPDGSTTPQAGAIRAYVDGQEFGRGSGAVLPIHQNPIGIGGINSDTRFHDGAVVGTGTQTFGGSLDDLRVYNRALSESEIADLIADYNTSPVANNDAVRAERNTPLTLLAMSLLANDSEADPEDNLSLVGVGNASNGSVSLNSEGKVVFTPSANFQGQASFEYTISDRFGATDTATVEVSVIAPSNSPYTIGTNLARIGAQATQHPFLNVFHSSRNWIWTASTPTETLNLDENGWLKSLPTSGLVLTELLVDESLSGRARYVVLYEGEGTITYGLEATKNEALSTPGRDVIDVDFDLSLSVPQTDPNLTVDGISLNIIETDPNQTGNYIRNIAVVAEADETTYQTEIFNPVFLEKTAPFGTLRFMDWGKTNNSPQIEWSDRATLTEARWTNDTGAPLEMMVELANRTQSHAWFTLPHMASDEYITNFAQYVKETLNPSLTIYVEYSNEVWNSGFGQYDWVVNQARQQWPNSTLSNFNLAMNWFSQRSTQVMQIWDGVFGTDKERVIGVVNTRAADFNVAERVLSYRWDPNPKSHEEYGIDALAISPYFGSYLGITTYESQVQSWTQDPDGGLNKLFDELTQGGVLTRSNGSRPAVVGGALQQAYTRIQTHAQIAQREGLLLLAAEAGQHLVGVGTVEDNEILTNLWIEANRDPRMGEIYKQYFQKWYELGGELANHLNDIRPYDENGSWGALEYLTQAGSPKYNALIDLINGNL